MGYMDSNKIGQRIENKLIHALGRTISEATNDEIYKAAAECIRDDIMTSWADSRKRVQEQGVKKLYYMSAEFLMGRAFSNNLINQGLYEAYREAFWEMGLDFDKITDEENDAGLGNGGLGRLAACFLDSLSTMELPVLGCGIRYEYGMFRQKIVDGTQIEMEDDWLRDGNVWEIERPELSVEVHFNGTIQENWTENGLKIEHKDYNTVIAVPYDVPIIGYKTKTPATLRLWSARSKRRFDFHSFNEGIYDKAMADQTFAEAISKVLYPSDDHMQGKMLRLKQFYFLASATMQSMIKRHKAVFDDLNSLPEHVVIQINETHPALAMPELMRILMDEEDFGWDEAYGVVKKIFHYTNHTIMTEAMECWDENMFRLLLPRIYQIICAINEKYCQKLSVYYSQEEEKVAQMAVIGNNEIRMANLCVAICHRINGVSNLHADILKTRIFKGSYQIFPQKYLAITNGITHRRWLALANQGLYHLIREYVKGDILKDYRLFEQILPYKDDKEFCKKYEKVKRNNKIRFAKYIKEKQGIEVNPESIFDVHCKRLHEYKRQLLKCLHIIYIYQKIKKDPTCITTPITFIFAAKAAPGYARAKEIIRLIHSIQEMVNKDSDMDGKIQVVFVENYCVSVAEMLIPAADISEQISTASKEASGTGNMKFMLNGAPTLGTMDGANVEIVEEVGIENAFIFGLSSDEVINYENNGGYNPQEIYFNDWDIKRVVDQLMDGTYSHGDHEMFRDLYNSLLNTQGGDRPDRYFILKDFRSYAEAQKKVEEAYKDPDRWAKMALLNTASCGKFTSDRTIQEYVDNIWKLDYVTVKPEA